MSRKKSLNAKALIKMIQDEKPQAEVMEKFGFKTSAQLKASYATALMETGQVPQLVKSTGRPAAKSKSNAITMNKRGSLIIPKDMIESYGYAEGDTFTVRKTKTGVSLKKAE